MPTPPEEYRFKPGQSGNPAGYSRGRRTTDALLRLIDEKGADDAIARVWLKRVLEGDFRYFKELLERTEGKVTQPIDADGETVVIVRRVSGGLADAAPEPDEGSSGEGPV